MATTYIYDAIDHDPYAYTTDGTNYYLSDSNSWWAYEQENHLYDAKTNHDVAYWDDKYLYDARTGEPLWYRT